MNHEDRIKKIERQVKILKRMVKDALSKDFEAKELERYKKLNEIFQLQKERATKDAERERRRNKELNCTLKQAIVEIRALSGEVANIKSIILNNEKRRY